MKTIIRNRTIFIIIILIFINSTATVFGQNAMISGTITKKEIAANESIIASIILKDASGIMISQVLSDSLGRYTFAHLQAGIYSLIISAPGYLGTQIKRIKLVDNQELIINIELKRDILYKKNATHDSITYSYPLIDMWDVSAKTTFSAEEIHRLPYRR